MKDDNKPHDDRPLILIVDADLNNVATKILIAALHDRYRVKTAIDGQTALNIVSQNPKPDLILLDVVMPEMDGYRLCQTIKNNPETQNINIIFITSLTEQADEVRGLKSGAIDWIHKSLQTQEIISRIHAHIHQQTHHNALPLNASVSKDAFQLERDCNGVIKFPCISPAVSNLYGIQPEEIGQSPQPLIDAIIRDDLPKLFASFTSSWKNLSLWRCEYRIYTQKGQVKWLLGEATPQRLENGAIRWNGTLSDISERKRSEEWLWFANCDLKLDDLILPTTPDTQPHVSPGFKLEIDFDQRCLCVGHRQVIMPPTDLAFYAWLASRAIERLEPVACPPDGVPIMDYAIDFLTQYRAIIGEMGDDERVTAALKLGMDKGYFLSRKSRVNKAIHMLLDKHSAVYYEIKCFGKRPRSVYAINADPSQITFLNPTNHRHLTFQ